MLHIYAALAEQERRMISQRTKVALAQAKRRGVQLGNPEQARRIGSRPKLTPSGCARY
jgi:DNA invertase Pin-like site-specific DNA recombinase